jgi:hypothetical protein
MLPFMSQVAHFVRHLAHSVRHVAHWQCLIFVLIVIGQYHFLKNIQSRRGYKAVAPEEQR